MEPYTDVILASQHISVPTGQIVVFELAELKFMTLNCEADLEVRRPPGLLARGRVAGLGGEERKEDLTIRPPGRVTLASASTRQCLRDVMNWGCFGKRYGSEEEKKSDFLFDMPFVLNPATTDLCHLEQMTSTLSMPMR